MFCYMSDVKKLNVDKLTLFKLPREMAEAFSLLTLEKINELYDIPILQKRKKGKIENFDIPHSSDSSSSSNEEENEMNRYIENDVLQEELNTYPLSTIFEEV